MCIESIANLRIKLFAVLACVIESPQISKRIVMYFYYIFVSKNFKSRGIDVHSFYYFGLSVSMLEVTSGSFELTTQDFIFLEFCC